MNTFMFKEVFRHCHYAIQPHVTRDSDPSTKIRCSILSNIHYHTSVLH